MFSGWFDSFGVYMTGGDTFLHFITENNLVQSTLLIHLSDCWSYLLLFAIQTSIKNAQDKLTVRWHHWNQYSKKTIYIQVPFTFFFWVSLSWSSYRIYYLVHINLKMFKPFIIWSTFGTITIGKTFWSFQMCLVWKSSHGLKEIQICTQNNGQFSNLHFPDCHEVWELCMFLSFTTCD